MFYKNMLLTELKVAKPDEDNKKYYNYIIERFTNLNYIQLGKGTFATIFYKPDLNFVYKIYINDNAYFKYLKYCLENINDVHLPKIYKIFKISDSNLGIIKMEKLEILDDIYDYQGLFNDQLISRLIKKYPKSIEKTYDNIRKSLNNVRMDVSISNIMKRKDNTLVFTDPVRNRGFEQQIKNIT